jgi:hypothetical protein
MFTHKHNIPLATAGIQDGRERRIINGEMLGRNLEMEVN